MQKKIKDRQFRFWNILDACIRYCNYYNIYYLISSQRIENKKVTHIVKKKQPEQTATAKQNLFVFYNIET